ncbi:hypothetical protein INT43_001760 [Umbelopsis isabellina]|uniref:Ubiquitin-like domain-containing protein n=1 Tax=Mortierella isabellina TaxID=91625 RepID=A0A8H7UGD6_MORIS|nr:hypothetical protein INT43_001760 [Umbelopsis isabellina]
MDDDYYETTDLHIRWSNEQDLVFTVSPKESVASVKEKIQELAPRTSDKHIRLIYSGRILESSNTLSHYGIGKIQRAENSKAKIPPPPPTYIHCSVSDYRPENDTTETKNSQPQITPLMGFDRLREAGFTEEDIRNIRTQFHHLHGTTFDGENTEQTRTLEEQWMENTGETLPDGTLAGTYKEMVWGLMLGFFMGLICLFWFRESVFTRRHQMGIIAGILINLSFGVLHTYV